MTREYTNKLYELIEEGILTYKQVFQEIMCYESEQWVKEFCETGFGGEIKELFDNPNGDE